MKANTSSWTAWASALLLAPAAVSAFAPPGSPHLLRARQAEIEPFNWSAVTPTADLRYHECYGGFQCARLKVPLDWSAVSSEYPYSDVKQHAAIAIVTLPAVVPPSDPAYGGPVLINPGGPGGSGTQTVLGAGLGLREAFDKPGKRHYDIVGIDPRGVFLSTPAASCYSTLIDRIVDLLQTEGIPSVITEQGLRVRFQTALGTSQLCAGAGGDDDDSSIFNHMSTAAVARDMIEFVDRAHDLRVGRPNAAATDKPRLKYYGISYGSHLGNTIASMFPGRVGRLVVDGVVDGDDFILTGGVLRTSLNDAEAAIDYFYKTCFDAGDGCPLRQKQDKSAGDIRRRVDSLMRSLETSPVPTVYNGRVALVTSELVSQAIRADLYLPLGRFEQLAALLAATVAGNYSAILSIPQALPFQSSDVCQAGEEGGAALLPAYTWAGDASAGVVCGDSAAVAGARNLSWARGVLESFRQASPTLVESWTQLWLSCTGWPFEARYAFHGPFGSPAPDPAARPDSTPEAPMLILSTRLDHVTPLESAYALSRLHAGSAVVVQDGPGHGVLLASRSDCTLAVIRDYLDSGLLPENNTVCTPSPECLPSIPKRECPGYFFNDFSL